MTRRGEIYWVDFGIPFGSEPGFKRPAVVVQNDTGNARTKTTIVAIVTSRIPPGEVPHIVVVQPRESGLPEPSAVLLHQLMTVDKLRLEERCGALSLRRMNEVDEALRASLALD